MYELWLASQSPRRRELLEAAGFLFRIDIVKISETIEENVNLNLAITRLAARKGQDCVDRHKQLKGHNILVLSADTMVVLKNQLLGKPKNPTEAQHFLRLLSGQTHHVVTGISLKNLATGESVDTFDSTEVEFRNLTDVEISEYVATGEPLDKAGAYGYQGLGRKFVATLRGSESNVIGLPMELFEKILREKGWHVARR